MSRGEIFKGEIPGSRYENLSAEELEQLKKGLWWYIERGYESSGTRTKGEVFAERHNIAILVLLAYLENANRPMSQREIQEYMDSSGNEVLRRAAEKIGVAQKQPHGPRQMNVSFDLAGSKRSGHEGSDAHGIGYIINHILFAISKYYFKDDPITGSRLRLEPTESFPRGASAEVPWQIFRVHLK